MDDETTVSEKPRSLFLLDSNLSCLVNLCQEIEPWLCDSQKLTCELSCQLIRRAFAVTP